MEKMPEYLMCWQNVKQGAQGEHTSIINYSETIIINRAEKDPDKAAKAKADKIFPKLGINTATLFKVIHRFSKT